MDSALAWLRDMVDLLERGDSAEEFLEHSRLNMHQDQVFCFTPKGDLISPAARGDADRFRLSGAYRSLGNQTWWALKVVGAHVPLHTPLRNGDQVERPIRQSGSTPSPLWEQSAVTGACARAEIRRYLKDAQHD